MSPLLYFIFALFIAGLLMAIVYLAHRLKKSQLEDSGGSIRDREIRLFKLYQNLEDMIGSMESYMEDATADVLREREELLILLQRIQIELQESSFAVIPSPMRNNLLLEADASQNRRALPSMAATPRQLTDGGMLHSRDTTVWERREGAYTIGAHPTGTYATGAHAGSAHAGSARATARPEETPSPMGRHGARKKIEDVRRLWDSGNTEEQIARELTLSRGEVALIVGMLQK